MHLIDCSISKCITHPINSSIQFDWSSINGNAAFIKCIFDAASIQIEIQTSAQANAVHEAIIKVSFCWTLELISTDHVRLAAHSFVEICWFEISRTSIEKNELKSIALAQITKLKWIKLEYFEQWSGVEPIMSIRLKAETFIDEFKMEIQNQQNGIDLGD